MSYPPSGPSGPNSGAYGQPDYGQQYGQPGYGQPQYPAQSASQGLPSATPKILAAVVGGFGVLQLFLGFLGVVSYDVPKEYRQYSDVPDAPAVFDLYTAMPYILLALAGFLALTTLLVGASKQFVSFIAALSIAAAFVTVFQFGSFETNEYQSRGAGLIVLLIFSILIALVSIFWWVVAAGFVKVAQAPAAPAAPHYG